MFSCYFLCRVYDLGVSQIEVDTDIHMDCMAFGMGMCCLQVTFQGRDVDESRYMYDQLAVLAPIMLAMTAATPIFKGLFISLSTLCMYVYAYLDLRLF